MQAIERFIRSARTPKGARHKTHANREGVPAFYRSLREQVVQILTTGTLGDTFYASGEKLAAEAMEVLLKARDECPEFFARALVWARNEGLMKTLPILGLAVLSGGRGSAKNLFETVFDQVVRIPDDMRAFVTLVRSGVIPGRSGLGGIVRDAVRDKTLTLTEYHAVKYGSAVSRGITLRDIVRMSHPRPTTDTIAERIGWLTHGYRALGANPALNPQIRALEALKRATDEDEILLLIRQGRLPFEAVIPALQRTTPRIWAELLRQAPYMNLLRNLATFTRRGVFQDETSVRYAVDRLTDPGAVRASKVLPFRFFTAWQTYVGIDESNFRIADALRKALELSFANMPSFGGRRIAIGTDVSGSMGGKISDFGNTRYIDIAGIFTGALLRRIEDRAILLPFESHVVDSRQLSPRDDILVTTEKLANIHGGGTAVGAPIEHLLDRKIAVDAFIGITDCEDWAYGNGFPTSESFLYLWRRYRTEVAPEARAFLVTIAPYRDAVAPQGEKGVRFIYGWSERVLRFISTELESGSGQVETIEAMNLSNPVGPNGPPSEIGDEDAETGDGS